MEVGNTVNNRRDLLVVGCGPGSADAVRQAVELGLKTGWVVPSEPGPEFQFPDPAVEVFSATDFKFEGPGRLRLNREHILEATGVVLAMSAVPVRVPGVEPDGVRIIQGTMGIENRMPQRRVLVAGGGADGVVLASRCMALGGRPVLVERGESLLRERDHDAVAFLAADLERRGAKIQTDTRLVKAEVVAGEVRCHLLRDGCEDTVEMDLVVTAVGGRPPTGDLGLETVDVIRDRRGRIQTDSRMESATPGLFAIGSMVPTPNDPELARLEAKTAVRASAGYEVEPLRYGQIVLGVKSRPELAWWGLTEAEAELRGYSVEVGQPAGQAGTLTKVVADSDTGRVLGLHLAGPEARKVLMRFRPDLENNCGAIDCKRLWRGAGRGDGS